MGPALRWILNDESILIYAIGFTIAQLVTTFYGVSLRPFIVDAIDYGELKTSVRVESLVFSGLTFTNKVGGWRCKRIIGFMLDSAGYVENAVEQTLKGIKTMFTATAIILLVAMVIIMIIMSPFDLEKNLKCIKEELIKKRLS